MYNAERDEGFDGVGSYAACGEPRENYVAITGVYHSCIYKHVCTTIFYYGSGKRKVGQKNDMF